MIAFDSNEAGPWNVYLIASQGGKPRRLTSGSGSKITPSWSHDGKWIYYCAAGSSGPQIWKKPATGGKEIRITMNGGCFQMESPDGSYLYYLDKRGTALRRVPAAGGEEVQLVEPGPQVQFAVGKHGIYFMDSFATNTLKFMDYGSGSIKTLGKLPGPAGLGLTVSSDEHWLLYGKLDSASSQLRLVEKFR